MEGVYDNKKKYHLDSSNMIVMKGDPDKYTNLMHAYNTWLYCFWSDYFGGGFWAQDQFLKDDIVETNKLLLELLNSESDVTIGILSFVDGIKSIPNPPRRAEHYIYPNQMTYYDDKHDKYGYSPIQIFHKTMELLKHESIQETIQKSCRKAKLPYINITVS